jgi:hypothetical protein
MSRSSELRLPRQRLVIAAAALVLMTLMALMAANAQAQQSPTAASIRALQDQGKEGDKAKPAPKDAAVSSSVPRSSGKRPLMRCWQEGKLVYEGAGMTTGPGSAAGAPIELRNGNAVALQIFDLKSGLCLLDHSAD